MATLDVQTFDSGGLAPVYDVCDAAGDEFLNTGREFLHIKNDSAGAVDVTIPTPSQVIGLEIEDRVVTVGAGSAKHAGPFPKRYFNNSEGKVDIGYSATGPLLTIAVLRM